MTALYAGLDVWLELISVCVFDEQGRMVEEARVVSEPYETIRELRAIPGDHLRVSALSACCLTLSS